MTIPPPAAGLSAHEAIHSRRSVRKYTDDPIPADVLDRILEAALAAPSAFNAQAREIVAITDPEIKQAIFDVSGQQQFLDSAVLFVVLGQSVATDLPAILSDRRAEKYLKVQNSFGPAAQREAAFRDASLAAANLMIAAQAEGVHTSPTSGWDEHGVKTALGIGDDENRHVVLVIGSGYPAESPEAPGRYSGRIIRERFT